MLLPKKPPTPSYLNKTWSYFTSAPKISQQKHPNWTNRKNIHHKTLKNPYLKSRSPIIPGSGKYLRKVVLSIVFPGVVECSVRFLKIDRHIVTFARGNRWSAVW